MSVSALTPTVSRREVEPARAVPIDWRPDLRSAAPTLRVALLGCGTVGSCVAALLLAERERFRRRCGLDLDLCSILVRNRRKSRDLPRHLFTDSFDELVGDRPDVIIEAMGGLTPATECIRRALKVGISVVTANKTVIAHHGGGLRRLARQRGATLAYEAAVGAAVPVLAALRQLEGDRVYSIKGILNGSTNYILTRMHDNGLSMNEALDEAAARGLIEPDPTADLSGRDAAEKLCILAAHVGVEGLSPDQINVAGIASVTGDDVLIARRMGYALRLVAELCRTPDGVQAQVGPALIDRRDRLASVRGEENGILIRSQLGGELLLLGRGAGPKPTASAILGDLLRLVEENGTDVGKRRGRPEGRVQPAGPDPVRGEPPYRDAPGGWSPRPHFLRVNFRRLDDGGRNTPRPADLFEALRQNGVSLRQIDVRDNAARLLTHPATGVQLRHVVTELLGEAASEASSLIAPLIACDEAAASDVEGVIQSGATLQTI